MQQNTSVPNNNTTSAGGGHRRHGPSRRRASRNNTTRSPAKHKNYASENDVADISGDAAFQKDLHAAGPHTPRKFSPPSPNPTPNSSLRPGSQSKPQSGAKNRSKNNAASPGPAKGARRTPPPSAASAKGLPSAAAFAGATFHASPAPSSLPIPSFMAAAVPDSPELKSPSRSFNAEPSPPPTDSERPTPVHKSSVARSAREESPLDFFFRADRAEKERAHRATSAGALAETAIGPFSPPSHPRQLREKGPGPPQAGNSPIHLGRRALFQQENADTVTTDLSAHSPVNGMGPAFSTPYQDRIRAARSATERSNRTSFHSDMHHRQQLSPQHQQLSPQHHQQQHHRHHNQHNHHHHHHNNNNNNNNNNQQQQQQHHQQFAVDRSEALKQFLFAGTAPPAAPVAHAQPANAQVFPNATSGAASFQQGQPRSYADAGDHQQAPDILALEDNLRRILKLDSSLHMTAQPQTFANAHSA